MNNYGNLEIYGIGNQNGGRFGKVVIAGSGKITGDVECDSFALPGAGKVEGGGLTVHGPIEIDGAGKVEGPVRGESLEVNGSFKVENGPCAVGGKADVSGSFKVAGDLTVGTLAVDGSTKVEGSVSAGEIEVDGVLKVEGPVQAETFRAEGAVRIDGLLNAETVELTVSGEDRIESIGGGSVRVRRGRSGFSLFSVQKRPHLSAELIEADEIDLEYTDCRTVRGVRVRIGPECVVDRVEDSGTLTTAADAQIGEKVKI